MKAPQKKKRSAPVHTGPDWVKIVQKIFSVSKRLKMVKITQKICFCQNYGAIVNISQPVFEDKLD